MNADQFFCENIQFSNTFQHSTVTNIVWTSCTVTANTWHANTFSTSGLRHKFS